MQNSGVGFQVSPKLPNGALINIQSQTAEEFSAALDWFAENAQKVAETVATLEAAYNVVNGGLTQPQAAPQVPQQYNQQAAPQAQNMGPSCGHGPMQHKTGITKAGPKAGQQWSGWFCSAGKDSGCAVKWA